MTLLEGGGKHGKHGPPLPHTHTYPGKGGEEKKKKSHQLEKHYPKTEAPIPKAKLAKTGLKDLRITVAR